MRRILTKSLQGKRDKNGRPVLPPPEVNDKGRVVCYRTQFSDSGGRVIATLLGTEEEDLSSFFDPNGSGVGVTNSLIHKGVMRATDAKRKIKKKEEEEERAKKKVKMEKQVEVLLLLGARLR